MDKIIEELKPLVKTKAESLSDISSSDLPLVVSILTSYTETTIKNLIDISKDSRDYRDILAELVQYGMKYWKPINYIEYTMIAFKESGKYYGEETIKVPDTIACYDVPEAIRNGTIDTPYKSMVRVFTCLNLNGADDTYSVPFAIYPEGCDFHDA